MQWLNCADQKNLKIGLDFNAGAKESLDLNEYFEKH